MRFYWQHYREKLLKQCRHHRYSFSPLQQYRFEDETLSVISSEDSLVLKVISQQLTSVLKKTKAVSPRCYHVKGHGGLKKAVSHTKEAIKEYGFVFKSDIKGYYASIQHDPLCDSIQRITGDKAFTQMIRRSLEAPITWGGLYYPREKGIPRGSPLSPVLGAIALESLDNAMAQFKDVYYARYMDDWVVLCKTRNRLRQVIKATHKILNTLQLTCHPDKTMMGRTDKGFDFLGYHIKPETLTVSHITLERAQAKLQQLYEQKVSQSRLAQYWRRFLQWCRAGLQDVCLQQCPPPDAAVAVLMSNSRAAEAHPGQNKIP